MLADVAHAGALVGETLRRESCVFAASLGGPARGARASTHACACAASRRPVRAWTEPCGVANWRCQPEAACVSAWVQPECVRGCSVVRRLLKQVLFYQVVGGRCTCQSACLRVTAGGNARELESDSMILWSHLRLLSSEGCEERRNGRGPRAPHVSRPHCR